MNDKMIREIAEYQAINYPEKPLIQKICERQMLIGLFLCIASYLCQASMSYCAGVASASALLYMIGRNFTKGWIND